MVHSSGTWARFVTIKSFQELLGIAIYAVSPAAVGGEWRVGHIAQKFGLEISGLDSICGWKFARQYGITFVILMFQF